MINLEQNNLQKEEEKFKASLIDNYCMVNKKLYEKIKELESQLQSINFAKDLTTTIESTSKRQDFLDNSMPTVQTFR